MLKRIFGIDSSFTDIMGKFADIVLVSFLWLLFSIPIITIATSTSAMYYAAVKGIRKERGTPSKEFLRFFKENWKQGIGLGIIYIGLGGLVGFNYYAVSYMDRDSLLYTIYRIEALWVIVLFIFLTLFLFPVFSRFEHGSFECIKTGLLLAVKHIVSSIFMTIALCAVVLLSARYPILIIFSPASTTLLFSLRIEKILRKYMKEPQEGEPIPWYWEDTRKVVQDDKNDIK